MAEDALEEAFAELQEIIEDQNGAEATAERLEKLSPGDADYDAIFDCHKNVDDPHAATKAELSELSRQWTERHEELNERLSELHDQLNEAGYDLREFYAEKLIKPKMRRLEKDPIEQQMRKTVTELLNKLYPQEADSTSGAAVATFAPGGASGYAGITDAEELAEVDVLDPDAPAAEGDLAPDKVTVYSEKLDTAETDISVAVDDSGAIWTGGFRIPKLMQVLLKTHQMDALMTALDALLGGCYGTLVAHGMGLGKSFTTLSILKVWTARFKDSRAIVICPKSMVNQWANELIRWEHVIDIDSYTVNGGDDTISRTLRPWFRHGGVVFVGHDQFKRSAEQFGITSKTIVVVDEAHLLKQKQTNLYQTIQAMESTRRIFLTGSPVQNNLGEFYSLIELLAPAILGATEGDFARLYANAIEHGMLKNATPAEVLECDKHIKALRWRVNYVVCEQSANILHDSIPPKHECCILHDCDTIASDSSVIKERHNVMAAARDCKVSTISFIIDTIHKNTDDNIVVFSTRNDLLKELHKHRPGHLYMGDMSIERRDKVLADFPACDGDIIYMATKAGGVGINLTSANHVIVADISWNPVDDNQAVARCYRMGQTKEVWVYRMVADLTLEKGIYLLGIKKHLTASRIMDDSDVPRHFSKQDLAELSGPKNKASDDDFVIESSDDATIAAIIARQPDNTVLDHDARVAADAPGDTLKKVDDQDHDAANLYNYISLQSPRFIELPSGVIETVDPKAHAFQDGSLCAPHVPVFMADKLGSSSGVLGNCEPRTVFTADTPIYALLGPTVTDLNHFSDLAQVKFRIEYRTVDEDDEDDWGSYMYDLPASGSSDCLALIHDPDSIKLAPGEYRFRLAIFDHEKMTPFSEETVKLSLSAQ